MKLIKKIITFTFSIAIFTACQKEEVAIKEPVKSEIVKDLAADPTTISGNGQPVASGKFTFYNFKNGIVPNTDSTTNKWDVAFRGTSILTNGGTSGPGQGGAVILNGIFDEVKEVPASTIFVQDTKTVLAIPASSGRGWYNYDAPSNIISPIAGKILLIRTGDGKFAKMEILNYYKGSPVKPDASSQSRHYTFRFVYQPDGSMKFN